MEIEFARNLIKGRIAEVIFEQMIREENRYTVIPFGYEHTMPTLAQYRKLAKVKSIIDNIADAPDFVLISKDHKDIYLVEVKYQAKLDIPSLKKYSSKLLQRWDQPWLFVATPTNFFCRLCTEVVAKGRINKLSARWVTKHRQKEYLGLMNEFEMRHTATPYLELSASQRGVPRQDPAPKS